MKVTLLMRSPMDTLLVGQRLGNRSREVTDSYSLPAVLDQWNALVKSVVSAHARLNDEHYLRDAVRTTMERRG